MEHNLIFIINSRVTRQTVQGLWKGVMYTSAIRYVQDWDLKLVTTTTGVRTDRAHCARHLLEQWYSTWGTHTCEGTRRQGYVKLKYVYKRSCHLFNRSELH
jgi:hypothetical protein